MAQERGKPGRGGLLIQGSDGSLWFIRDGGAKPVQLEDDLADSINRLLGEAPRLGISGLSPEIQKLLADQFDIPIPWGIVVWWSARLPQ